MEFIKFIISSSDNTYKYVDASNIMMNILGNFLVCDVWCSDQKWPSFKDWALDDSLGMGVGGNVTFLEKENNYIYLTDAYSQEKIPAEVKMTRQQFVQLLDDWEEKVCKLKPKRVIIKHDNDQFIIETNE
jgi:hypothetical protein